MYENDSLLKDVINCYENLLFILCYIKNIIIILKMVEITSAILDEF